MTKPEGTHTMPHPPKHEIRVTSVQIAELQHAMKWFEALPKAEREEIRAYLNTIPGVKATSSGIGRYWKLAIKGKTPYITIKE